MDQPDPDAATNRRVGWLAALVLGTVVGIGVLETGVIGIGIAVLALGLIWWKGPRLLGLGGFICGFAGTWALLFWQVVARCDAAQLPPGETCSSGVTSAYLAGSVVFLVIGVGLTIVSGRRGGDGQR